MSNMQQQYDGSSDELARLLADGYADRTLDKELKKIEAEVDIEDVEDEIVPVVENVHFHKFITKLQENHRFRRWREHFGEHKRVEGIFGFAPLTNDQIRRMARRELMDDNNMYMLVEEVFKSKEQDLQNVIDGCVANLVSNFIQGSKIDRQDIVDEVAPKIDSIFQDIEAEILEVIEAFGFIQKNTIITIHNKALEVLEKTFKRSGQFDHYINQSMSKTKWAETGYEFSPNTILTSDQEHTKKAKAVEAGIARVNNNQLVALVHRGNLTLVKRSELVAKLDELGLKRKVRDRSILDPDEKFQEGIRDMVHYSGVGNITQDLIVLQHFVNALEHDITQRRLNPENWRRYSQLDAVLLHDNFKYFDTFIYKGLVDDGLYGIDKDGAINAFIDILTDPEKASSYLLDYKVSLNQLAEKIKQIGRLEGDRLEYLEGKEEYKQALAGSDFRTWLHEKLSFQIKLKMAKTESAVGQVRAYKNKRKR